LKKRAAEMDRPRTALAAQVDVTFTSGTQTRPDQTGTKSKTSTGKIANGKMNSGDTGTRHAMGKRWSERAL
jgi:hypothetical protein